MTAAFLAYLAPARRYPQFWRLLLGLPLLTGLYLLWLWLLGTLLLRLDPAGADPASGVPHPLLRMRQGEEPGAMLMLFASFGGMALAVLLVARLLCGQGPASLLGPRRILWRDFAVSALVVGLTGGILITLLSRYFQLRPGLEPAGWLFLLPMALCGIALQTLAEELLFRGWLMQRLAVRFASPLIWFVLPALVFAGLHYDPQGAGANAIGIVIAVALLAFAMADLTRRTGSLGAAWGFHFANNCLALLVLATGPSLSGLALFQTPWEVSDPALFYILLADMVAGVLAWALLARILGRRTQAA